MVIQLQDFIRYQDFIYNTPSNNLKEKESIQYLYICPKVTVGIHFPKFVSSQFDSNKVIRLLRKPLIYNQLKINREYYASNNLNILNAHVCSNNNNNYKNSLYSPDRIIDTKFTKRVEKMRIEKSGSNVHISKIIVHISKIIIPIEYNSKSKNYIFKESFNDKIIPLEESCMYNFFYRCTFPKVTIEV